MSAVFLLPSGRNFPENFAPLQIADVFYGRPLRQSIWLEKRHAIYGYPPHLELGERNGGKSSSYVWPVHGRQNPTRSIVSHPDRGSLLL